MTLKRVGWSFHPIGVQTFSNSGHHCDAISTFGSGGAGDSAETLAIADNPISANEISRPVEPRKSCHGFVWSWADLGVIASP
jgi:hypothetical protein